MSEETPEIEPTESEEKPKRRRRRKKAEPSSEASATGVSSPSEPPPAEVGTVADEPSADVAPQAEEEQGPEAELTEAEEEEPKAAAEADTAQPDTEAQTPAPPARRGAAAPAAAPRRRRRRGEVLDVEVRAQAKYVRSSARKARLVCDHIRGKSVEEARAILAHTPRAIARDWSKLLESAVANAEHNHELIGEDLYVKMVRADEGPTIKRYRPRALGRATRIRKRTSHLTILLKPKP